MSKNCPNCSLFYNKCAAKCCGPVPIKRSVFNANFHLVQRPVEDLMDFVDETVIAKTADLTCPFLSSDFKCQIYNDRPDVCKEFGSEVHPHMTCSFQTKDGKARSEKETRKIEQKQLTLIKTHYGI